MRTDKRKVKRLRIRVRTQREVLRDVMLSANECEAWLTLAELGAMTRYPETSISAQLRHLKKPQFGNYELEKQQRTGAGVDAGNGHSVEWEYRLTRRRRVVRKRVPVATATVSALEQTGSEMSVLPADCPPGAAATVC
jgi:hypothetical protein